MAIFRKKALLLMVLCFIAIILKYVIPGSPALLSLYDNYFYYPLQSLRGLLFGWLPFSLGDILYIASGIGILVLLVKWLRYVRNFQRCKWQLAASLANTLNAAVAVYLFFSLGWGVNYAKMPLRESWGFNSNFSFKKDSAALIAFDQLLIDSLNALAPAYKAMPLHDVNTMARANYCNFTDSKVSRFGVHVKPTMFGYFMDRVAIEGYYNPFTGEGQINSGLPAFMLPFVVSHEMAHQAGIAAEGDANLMAFSVCTMSIDRSFNYSGYLNIWLYVNARLYYKDSVTALRLSSNLNKLTAAHIDTIEQMNDRSNNEVSRYSTSVYDSYLKMQNQKDGIHSYGSVAANAYLLEQRRKTGREKIIHVP